VILKKKWSKRKITYLTFKYIISKFCSVCGSE